MKLGADAAAGPKSREVSVATDATLRAEILSHSRARGAFAGISLSGSTLRPDSGANKDLYRKEISAEAIVLEKEVAAPPSANRDLCGQIFRPRWTSLRSLSRSSPFMW